MPIPTSEILSLVSDLSEEQNIKVAATESVKGGLLTGAATVIGGLAMGPVGLLAGGVFGGVTSFVMSQGKFESVPSIIMKMEPSKRELLAHRVRSIVSELDSTDLVQLSVFMLAPDIKAHLVQEVIAFFQSQMSMRVLC